MYHHIKLLPSQFTRIVAEEQSTITRQHSESELFRTEDILVFVETIKGKPTPTQPLHCVITYIERHYCCPQCGDLMIINFNRIKP